MSYSHDFPDKSMDMVSLLRKLLGTIYTTLHYQRDRCVPYSGFLNTLNTDCKSYEYCLIMIRSQGCVLISQP